MTRGNGVCGRKHMIKVSVLGVNQLEVLGFPPMRPPGAPRGQGCQTPAGLRPVTLLFRGNETQPVLVFTAAIKRPDCGRSKAAAQSVGSLGARWSPAACGGAWWSPPPPVRPEETP